MMEWWGSAGAVGERPRGRRRRSNKNRQGGKRREEEEERGEKGIASEMVKD